MVALSIITNAALVRQGLQNLRSEIPKIGRRKIYDAMNRITRKMEAYPAERASQKYVRTGRLGRSWKVKRLDNGYIISSDARKRGRSYSRYVVGTSYGTGQAWMHVGRWQKLRDVAEEEIAGLPPEIEREINMVSRRVGL